MTKEDIIEMAKRVGFVDYELDDGTTSAFDKRYKAFAELVAQHEREKFCSVLARLHDSYSCASDPSGIKE